MTTSLNITKALSGDNKFWQITATVIPGGTLPLDIFAYENKGTNTLGDYIGVCNLEEYQRLSTFSGTPIVMFGHRFVKFSEAKIQIDVKNSADLVISHLIKGVTSLSLAISNSGTSTQIVLIP